MQASTKREEAVTDEEVNETISDKMVKIAMATGEALLVF